MMPPLWDAGAEQAVIGAIAGDARCLAEVAAIVAPEDFYSRANQRIVRAALAMHAQGEVVDIVTLGGAIREHAAYLGEAAANAAGASANVAGYARMVADYARRRALVAACRTTIEAAATSGAVDLIADLSARIEAAGERAIGESLDFAAVLARTAAAIESARVAGADGVVGVPTGLPAVDSATSGLCRRRLFVIAARPSVGKTALANQIAINAARGGHAIGVCSLEMGEEEIGARAIAYHCRVNFTRLLRGRADVAMVQDPGPAAAWPLHLDTGTYALAAIEARITGWVRQHGIAAAVVDHIGLVEVGGNISTYDRVSLVSRRLKKLAKRLNIAIVAVAQLNRGPEIQKRKPSLGDLRDSGNIEQDMDIGLFLHAEPEDLGAKQMPVALGFLKNRTGRRGWLPEPLIFEGAYQTFSEKRAERAVRAVG